VEPVASIYSLPWNGCGRFLGKLVSVNQIALHHTLKDQLLNIHYSCKILGFCICAVEVSTLVECCTSLVSSLLLKFWNDVLVPPSRVEQARGNSWTACPLILGPVCCPPVVAANYQSPSCDIPESEDFTIVASLCAFLMCLYENENYRHHYTLCIYTLVILICFF
jgi:hypothetical protein